MHRSFFFLSPCTVDRAPIINAFRSKKLSAIRDVIFDFHYHAGRLALGEFALLMGKLQIQHLALVALVGGLGWQDGWIAIPALASACLPNKTGFFMIVEGCGILNWYVMAFFGVGET
jgi:hypothetical protein